MRPVIAFVAVLFVAFSADGALAAVSGSAAEMGEESETGAVDSEKISWDNVASTDPRYHPYNPHTAHMLSTLSTLGGLLAGGACMLTLVVGSSDGQVNVPLVVSGISLMSLGLIVGPSAGHFYSRNTRRALGGMLVRFLLSSLVPLGVGGAFIGALSGSGPAVVVGLIGSIGASIGLLAHVSYSIRKAPESAREANEKHRSPKAPVYFSPVIFNGARNSASPGVSFGGTF